ncbi:MAG: hypothetical protein IT348_15155 [Candidatus Eisenbacteria bacterium]|nr:hypothetical protein [Candidatus Eisenbacteria bacterium]
MDLPGVLVRVEQWRRGRANARVPIPEELWSAAVDLARVHGVNATARALRFDYYGLKARMDEGLITPAGEKGGNVSPFVELQSPSLDAGGHKGETTVEFVGRQGERMRIVAAPGAVDLVGLARAFWSRPS